MVNLCNLNQFLRKQKKVVLAQVAQRFSKAESSPSHPPRKKKNTTTGSPTAQRSSNLHILICKGFLPIAISTRFWSLDQFPAKTASKDQLQSLAQNSPISTIFTGIWAIPVSAHLPHQNHHGDLLGGELLPIPSLPQQITRYFTVFWEFCSDFCQNKHLLTIFCANSTKNFLLKYLINHLINSN